MEIHSVVVARSEKRLRLFIRVRDLNFDQKQIGKRVLEMDVTDIIRVHLSVRKRYSTSETREEEEEDRKLAGTQVRLYFYCSWPDSMVVDIYIYIYCIYIYHHIYIRLYIILYIYNIIIYISPNIYMRL